VGGEFVGGEFVGGEFGEWLIWRVVNLWVVNLASGE
jgi:hypothetical protein